MPVSVYVWRRFSVVSLALTHTEWSMWCFAGKGGLSVSTIHLMCFTGLTFGFTSYPPSTTTFTTWTFLPFPPVPSLQPVLSDLCWKGERMLSPHKSQSLLVLQERSSCHGEAPASLPQKTKLKRKSERKAERGRFWAGVGETTWMKVWERKRDELVC